MSLKVAYIGNKYPTAIPVGVSQVGYISSHIVATLWSHFGHIAPMVKGQTKDSLLQRY